MRCVFDWIVVGFGVVDTATGPLPTAP